MTLSPATQQVLRAGFKAAGYIYDADDMSEITRIYPKENGVLTCIWIDTETFEEYGYCVDNLYLKMKDGQITIEHGGFGEPFETLAEAINFATRR